MFNRHYLTGMIAVLLTLPLVAVADHHRGGDERGDHRGHMERMANQLDLNEEQRAEWQELHEAHHPRMQELREEIKEARGELQDAARQDDRQGMETAADRIAQLTRESSITHARMQASVHNLLNEEQQEKLMEMHEKRGMGMGHGHGMDRDHGSERGKDKSRRGERGNR